MRTRRVSLVDLAVILLHVLKANQLPEHGHVDADRTLTELLNALGHSFANVPESALESGLFYCNTLSEKDLFKDPRGADFDALLKRIGPFNKDYHWLDEDQLPETD